MTAPAAPPPARAASRPRKFVALAWIAFAFGLTGLAGSLIIILNILTAILAGVGVLLGVIALFGSKKILAGISTVMCIAAIVITLQVQASLTEELNRIGTQFDQDTEQLDEQFRKDMDDADRQLERDLNK